MTNAEFTRLARVLMDSGADALTIEISRLSNWDQQCLSELLVHLACLGGTGWPTALYRLGADINFRNDEGHTALSQCVHGSMIDEQGRVGAATFVTATELLALGCDPNSSYMGSVSVTALAVACGCPELAVLFLLAGADLGRIEPDPYAKDNLHQVLENSDYNWSKQILKILHDRRGQISTIPL